MREMFSLKHVGQFSFCMFILHVGLGLCAFHFFGVSTQRKSNLHGIFNFILEHFKYDTEKMDSKQFKNKSLDKNQDQIQI